MKKPRKTIQKEIFITGVGIHSGQPCSVRLLPAPVFSGLCFRRLNSDDEPKRIIPTSIYKTIGSITVSDEITNHRIKTIEHLLCALRALEITDVLIENETEEIPITDGSASVFFDSLKAAGIKEYASAYEPIQIEKQISIVNDNEEFAIVYPATKPEFSICYTTDMNHFLLKEKTFAYTFDPETIEKEILIARTFGFKEDMEKLKSRGMALGASDANAVDLSNPEILHLLRCSDEPIRHKILDFIGDLYSVGLPIYGNFVIHKGNHKLHIALAKRIFEEYKLKQEVEEV